MHIPCSSSWLYRWANTVKEMAGGQHMYVDACVCAALPTQLLRAPAKELSL